MVGDALTQRVREIHFGSLSTKRHLARHSSSGRPEHHRQQEEKLYIDDSYLPQSSSPVTRCGRRAERQARGFTVAPRASTLFFTPGRLPVTGEDQSDGDRAENSEKELEEGVTYSVEGDGIHLKQFRKGAKGSGYSEKSTNGS